MWLNRLSIQASSVGVPGRPTCCAIRIRDPEVLRAEFAVVRREYNTVPPHGGIGYVTPKDDHDGPRA